MLSISLKPERRKGKRMKEMVMQSTNLQKLNRKKPKILKRNSSKNKNKK
jgi:hypothetical protein